jgi:molybdopterin converting factor small subunit
MRVTVRLFARLRDIAGASELARELAPGATIGDVWRQLAGEFPELSQYERSISSAVKPTTRGWIRWGDGTKSRFCRRSREARKRGTGRAERMKPGPRTLP